MQHVRFVVRAVCRWYGVAPCALSGMHCVKIRRVESAERNALNRKEKALSGKCTEWEKSSAESALMWKVR